MAQRKEHSDSASRQTATNSYQVAGKTAANGMVFQVDRKDPVILLSVSASVQDLRSLDMEKETKEIVRESPRGILEDCMRSLETESETSMASTSSYSEAPGNACIASYWGGFFNFWKKRSLKRLSTFPPFGVPKLSKRYTRSARENPTSKPLIDEAHLCCFKPSWRNFSLTEISAATSNFSSENIIGKGGYAEVYKGCLQDGQLVAIKRLTRGTAEERIADFLSEIGIIVHINHPNAAKLIGFCVEGGMHLVLQLSPHGSLASRLHDSNEKLDWSIRYKVALGTAEGLNYLHVGCQRRIIHRDIKAANILLTEDFEPQICDFGLAKWLPDQWTHHTVSNFEGTFGYIAPEYFMHGIVNEKTDVFAFGVLLLELITGRKALDCSQQSLVMWAKPLLDENDMRELIDPSLDDVYDPQQMHRVALAASLSIQHSPLMRPNMGQVTPERNYIVLLYKVHLKWADDSAIQNVLCQIVQLLKGEGSLKSIKLSQRPLLQRTYSEELFDANEYNSTRYLNDLNRHRQLALDF